MSYEENKSKRFDYIDLIKAIDIFFVIMIHNYKASVDFVVSPSLKTYISFIVRLMIEGVPLFVTVNGFLIINKRLDLRKHIKKIMKILLIIFIWSLIYIIIFSKGNISAKEIIHNILTVDINNEYSGILWFLQNLITLYLLYPILNIVHDNNKKVYNYFFIVVVFFTIGTKSLDMIFNLLNLYNINDYTYWLSDCIQHYNPISNGAFILYFMLGGYIYENKELLLKNKNKIFIITLLITIVSISYGIFVSDINKSFYSSNYLYCSLAMVMYILSIFIVSFKFKNNNFFTRIICSIGKNSMGIYLVHIIVVKLVSEYITFVSLGKTIISSIIIVFICLCITIVLRKIPYVNKIITI